MKPGLKLSDVTGPPPPVNGADPKPAEQNGGGGGGGGGESAFTKYAEFIDTKAGTLNFKNKAILHGGGVEFSSGHSFKISLDEVDRLDELGKGNYGTVYKVRHSRPQMRKPGTGLGGIVSRVPGHDDDLVRQDNLSGVTMAMKEIRLELDESKFAQIIMELDILHRCVSPFIIDFYGAFFQEGAVYMCVEFMDGGSIDKLYEGGVPENILRKVTLSTIMGLKALKDEHNIIHRDVKPTNILINSKGQIKICDFGVSGNLVASIAKTNIGCQSYMAPERIAGGGMQQSGASSGGTYSVQSDVWSLGLSVIECAMGRYPYPPETFTNIFSQLHVSGLPTNLTLLLRSNLIRIRQSSMANRLVSLNLDTRRRLMHSCVLASTRAPKTDRRTTCYCVMHGLCLSCAHRLRLKQRLPPSHRNLARILHHPSPRIKRSPTGSTSSFNVGKTVSSTTSKSQPYTLWLWTKWRTTPDKMILETPQRRTENLELSALKNLVILSCDSKKYFLISGFNNVQGKWRRRCWP
jgi:serine/threonine protein kinase